MAPQTGYSDRTAVRTSHDFFGSAGIAYTPIAAFSVALSYSGRVERPDPFSLTETKSMADFYNEFFVGNPQLQSAYSRS